MYFSLPVDNPKNWTGDNWYEALDGTHDRQDLAHFVRLHIFADHAAEHAEGGFLKKSNACAHVQHPLSGGKCHYQHLYEATCEVNQDDGGIVKLQLL